MKVQFIILGYKEQPEIETDAVHFPHETHIEFIHYYEYSNKCYASTMCLGNINRIELRPDGTLWIIPDSAVRIFPDMYARPEAGTTVVWDKEHATPLAEVI